MSSLNVFYGPNRKNSDKDKCVVFLCPEHHRGNGGIHQDHHLDLIIKERMEYAWCKYYNKTKEDFLKRYHRNYIS